MTDNKINPTVKFQYLLAGLLILMIVPLLILHFYNQPTPEDFYYSGEAGKIGLLNSLRVLYKFFGGRYLTYFLVSINPLYFGSITGYKICTLLLMLLFFFILFLFVSEFTKSSLNLRERILFSLSFFVLYLLTMSSLSQGFYWLVSFVHYNFALMLIMLFAVFYSKISKETNDTKKYFFIFILCVITAAIPGTVEIAAGTMLFIVTLIFINDLYRNKKFSLWHLAIFVITVICVYYVVRSPGNEQRSERYTENHQLLFSAGSSFVFLIKSVISWIFISPLAAFSILSIPFCLKIASKTGKRSLTASDILKPALILLMIIYLNVFIVYWSLGIPPYDRILDFIYFIFLIGWFAILISIAKYLGSKYNFVNFRISKIIYTAAAIIIVVFVIKENNLTKAWHELFTGKASEYCGVVNQRYDFIRNSASDSIEVDRIEKIPATFFFQDITDDPKRPFNLGYGSFFKKNYIVIKADSLRN